MCYMCGPTVSRLLYTLLADQSYYSQHLKFTLGRTAGPFEKAPRGHCGQVSSVALVNPSPFVLFPPLGA